MPTDWQKHLTEVREKNKDFSLKQCMQIASETYKGVKKTETEKGDSDVKSYSKKTQLKRKKSQLCQECENTCNGIVEMTNDLLQVSEDMEKKHVTSLKRILTKLEEIRDEYIEDASETESSEEDD